MTTLNPNGSITVDATGLQPYVKPYVEVSSIASPALPVATITIATHIMTAPERHHSDVLNLRAHPAHLRAMAEQIIAAMDEAEPRFEAVRNVSNGLGHGGL